MPSELLPLTWNDINWSENKILIHSPKTEHIDGKGTRLMPLFPELLPYLQEAFELAEPGQKYLITRFRHKDVNLGTQAHRIIKQAGLKPWPKTFQNLRASRETELVENFPIHVVTDWLVLQREVVINYPVYMSSIDLLRCLCLAIAEGFALYGKSGLDDCVPDSKQSAWRLVGILPDVPAAVKLVQ